MPRRDALAASTEALHGEVLARHAALDDGLLRLRAPLDDPDLLRAGPVPELSVELSPLAKGPAAPPAPEAFAADADDADDDDEEGDEFYLDDRADYDDDDDESTTMMMTVNAIDEAYDDDDDDVDDGDAGEPAHRFPGWLGGPTTCGHPSSGG